MLNEPAKLQCSLYSFEQILKVNEIYNKGDTINRNKYFVFKKEKKNGLNINI